MKRKGTQGPTCSPCHKRERCDDGEDEQVHCQAVPPKKPHNLGLSSSPCSNAQSSRASIQAQQQYTDCSMYYETGENQVVNATPQLKELHSQFMRAVWGQSSIPGSCTLFDESNIVSRQKEGKEDKTSKKPLLQRRLLHNVIPSTDKMQEVLARYPVLTQCDQFNVEELYSSPVNYHYYHLSICPRVNYQGNPMTKITIDDRGTYIFQGFILASQENLNSVPVLCFQKYGYRYQVRLEKILQPPIFTVKDVLLFEEYVFNELLQLYSWIKALKCIGRRMLFVPQFCKPGGSELLSMAEVLKWLVNMRKPLLSHIVRRMKENSRRELLREADGWLVTHPDRVPSCIRVDRLEWPTGDDMGLPNIIHFSSAFSENQQEKCAEATEIEEFHRVSKKELILGIPADCIYITGMYTDTVQYTLILPLLVGHVLFHASLSVLEDRLHYHFNDRQLFQRALTHCSYTPSGTVLCEEVRVISSNCALHRPRIKSLERKEGALGISAVIEQAEKQSEEEKMLDNEQLEFLGDATLEFICSLHLYHLLPRAKLGQLALYRTVLVKNKHLAVLANQVELRQFMLFGDMQSVAGKSEVPTESTESTKLIPSHMDANAIEALIGAVYLDGGLKRAQQLTARLLFPDEVYKRELYKIWLHYPLDSLQLEHSEGDRHLIAQSTILKQMTNLEKLVGVEFTHICLLARAFTHSSVGYTSIVGGNYEKLEHLGDASLQFLASNFVYHKFPTLHEGHLSLLRTALVHNKQLAKVSKQLGFEEYIQKENVEIGGNILADVVESYLAALLLDKGLAFCKRFLEVCLFPKLSEAVQSSMLEDPNTQLQKAAAHLCRQHSLKQEIPYYRVLKTTGSASSPQFKIAVYFKGYRLGVGNGLSHREARQKAAENALSNGKLNEYSVLWAAEEQQQNQNAEKTKNLY